jgi:hypothetical protein
MQKARKRFKVEVEEDGRELGASGFATRDW